MRFFILLAFALNVALCATECRLDFWAGEDVPLSGVEVQVHYRDASDNLVPLAGFPQTVTGASCVISAMPAECFVSAAGVGDQRFYRVLDMPVDQDEVEDGAVRIPLVEMGAVTVVWPADVLQDRQRLLISCSSRNRSFRGGDTRLVEHAQAESVTLYGPNGKTYKVVARLPDLVGTVVWESELMVLAAGQTSSVTVVDGWQPSEDADLLDE